MEELELEFKNPIRTSRFELEVDRETKNYSNVPAGYNNGLKASKGE